MAEGGTEETLTNYMAMKKQNRDLEEPNVINDDLIRQYIIEYNRENKIFGQDQLPFSQLTHLELSFKNLQMIVNMDGMVNLKKLVLNTIGGLDNQENLTDLSLYNNQISEVKGLNSCQKLNVLSLGNNKITQKDKLVAYLKDFKHLQVINLQGNEIAKESEYKAYIVAHLKYLKYIDYSVIDEETRNNAKNEYRSEDILAEGSGQQEDELHQEEETILEYKRAHIQCTINLFEDIQAEDKADAGVYEVISKLPGFADFNDDYKQKVQEATERYQKEMLTLNSSRLNYITNFQTAIKEAEERATQQSIELIQDFQRKKKILQKQIDSEEIESEEIVAALRGLQWAADELEEKLMDIENELVESIEENQKNLFGQILREIVEKMRSKTMEFTSKTLVEGFTRNYFKELTEEARRQQEKFTQSNQQEQFSKELAEILQDKDTLTNALQQSQEFHEEKVNQCEKKILGGLSKENEQLQTSFFERQHERNRQYIREICELLQKIRKEIEEQLNEAIEEEDND